MTGDYRLGRWLVSVIFSFLLRWSKFSIKWTTFFDEFLSLCCYSRIYSMTVSVLFCFWFRFCFFFNFVSAWVCECECRTLKSPIFGNLFIHFWSLHLYTLAFTNAFHQFRLTRNGVRKYRHRVSEDEQISKIRKKTGIVQMLTCNIYTDLTRHKKLQYANSNRSVIYGILTYKILD